MFQARIKTGVEVDNQTCMELGQGMDIERSGGDPMIGPLEIMTFLNSLPPEMSIIPFGIRSFVGRNFGRKNPPNLPFELCIACTHNGPDHACVKVFFDGQNYLVRVFHLCPLMEWQCTGMVGRAYSYMIKCETDFSKVNPCLEALLEFASGTESELKGRPGLQMLAEWNKGRKREEKNKSLQDIMSEAKGHFYLVVEPFGRTQGMSETANIRCCFWENRI